MLQPQIHFRGQHWESAAGFEAVADDEEEGKSSR
jgi:hypothetical protein